MLELPPLAIYVHLPWCVRKCPYCDFNSHALKPAGEGTAAEKALGTAAGVAMATSGATSAPRLPPDQEAAYLNTLLADLRQDLPLLEGAAPRSVSSVFIGGGTPSLFSAEGIALLLHGLRQELPFANDCEVTLEANPGTLECGRFAGYKQAGVNRISVGAQTFSAAQLKALGRIHGAADTHAAVAELHAAGLLNHNLDLMYALPGQTTAEALADVEAALALAPPHLSYYQLTLEPGTVFHHRPPAAMPDDEAAADLEAAAHARLRAAGFHRYEVSAWAQPGHACRHNLNYWNFGDYLGLGAGAHGKLTRPGSGEILRTTKQKQPREYQRDLAAARTVESIPPGDRPFEYMLNALRLADGFSVAGFEQRTGLDWRTVEPTVARLAELGWLEPAQLPVNPPVGVGSTSAESVARAANWRPTPRGYAVLNALVEAFLPDNGAGSG
jgi:oxygen-independent coproporphyrinogen-3 oxidase